MVYSHSKASLFVHECQGRLMCLAVLKYFRLKVVTFKNHALDHFLDECLSKIPSRDLKLVRVGTQGTNASPALQKRTLGKVRWMTQ